MFIQVIQGRSPTPTDSGRRWTGGAGDLQPGAIGWLGTTAEIG